MPRLPRRKFMQQMGAAAVFSGLGGIGASFAQTEKEGSKKINDTNRFKISLNAYSFNKPLMNKETDLEALISFCAKEGFDAIDMTGYYFPGYPAVPGDAYIYQLKNKAHRMGVEISGTGIRNDFGDPDAEKRKEQIEFVKNWIDVAAKLGAPVIRIFTAREKPANYSWEETEKWIIDAIATCAEYGKQKGVILAVQNHNDFIKTADQAMDILQKANSDWLGLVLDTGSFVTEEPYSEIAKVTQYAVNWQIKEKLNYQGNSMDMDLERLFRIVWASTYRGYLPIETLSPGDPFGIVPPFLQKVKKALAKAEKG
ncbi:MAG: sugar phosphate isomerase/epimerase [Bacteroidota bacterium]|nr:sugar phosphate isomerase/epimerase [Bacteroidota bacterium]